MMLNETKQVGILLKALRRRLTHGVVFKHQDARTAGIPDFSVTAGGSTSWWEGKVTKNDRVHGLGLQHLTMRELAISGKAWYIIWDGVGVCIAEPKHISSTGMFSCHQYSNVDTADFVIEFILKQHSHD